MEANPGVVIPALRESLDDVRRGLGEWTVRVVREPSSGRLVGAVRGRLDSHGEWDIGRIMVAPDLQGRGLGRALLELVEDLAPADVTTYVLFTGAGSADNQRMYKKAGFRLRAGPQGAARSRRDDQEGRVAGFPADATLWQTSPLVRSRPGSPGCISRCTAPGIRRTAPATGGAPAGHTGHQPIRHHQIPRLTCGTREEHVMTNVIADLGNALKRDDVPAFRAGDTVKVHVKVIEGSRSRVQVFQGVVIRIHGSGIGRTFTVRKVSFGVGVERTFPLNSPIFETIEIVTRGDVRRAKLYYLRNLRGKAAKIKERREA